MLQAHSVDVSEATPGLGLAALGRKLEKTLGAKCGSPLSIYKTLH